MTLLLTELSHGHRGKPAACRRRRSWQSAVPDGARGRVGPRRPRSTISDAGVVEVTGGPVPESLLGAIADRLDFLRCEVREMLQAAALLGVEFLVADLVSPGDMVTARQHLSSAAVPAEQIGDRVVSSLALARSLDHEIADEPEEALAVLTACLAGPRRNWTRWRICLPEAARLAALTGARRCVDRTSRRRLLTSRSGRRCRIGLGPLLTAGGCWVGVLRLLLLAAEQYEEAGRPLLRAKALEAAAANLAEQGDRGSARSAFVRADDLYEELGATWDLARLRADFRRLGIRRGPRTKHRRVRVGWDSLTPSEAKVAGLVAEGLSNRQIAERLVLSTRTVESHVSHILAKLGVRSRVDIVRQVTIRTGEARGGRLRGAAAAGWGTMAPTVG